MDHGSTMVAVTADALCNMDDEQLRDFMARHYIPGGNYELPVDDWETLPVADRLRLGERLK